MRKNLWLLLAFLTAAPFTRAEISADDTAGIRATLLDYIEGWYNGDAARMEHALHPDLAKRTPVVDAKSGRTNVQNLSALALVQATRAGHGKGVPPADQQKDIVILDTYENLATAKLVSHRYVDYFQLVKTGDRWLIVNVLWKFRPQPADQK